MPLLTNGPFRVGNLTPVLSNLKTWTRTAAGQVALRGEILAAGVRCCELELLNVALVGFCDGIDLRSSV